MIRAFSAIALVVSAGANAQTPAASPVPSYRIRILGVFDLQSGQPIEGAEVTDIFSHTTALTTKTGTVSLAFLPEGGSMLRIQKIGFKPMTQVVVISPADTVPITVLMEATAQTLPTVVTKDSATTFLTPGLRAFEERRKAGGGRFITEAELRKNDSRGPITNVIRGSGTTVRCTTRTPIHCFAVSNRRPGNPNCALDVYYDGVLVTGDNGDLEMIRTDQISAVEIYDSSASVPPLYNKTSNGCGVMLFWSRVR
jgi:hypothetical protein